MTSVCMPFATARERSMAACLREEPDNRPFQMHLGALAHAAIGGCLTRASQTSQEPTYDPAVIVRALAADPLRHDRRRGEILLRGYVRSYIDNFLPAPPWQIEAIERRLLNGRVDLIFRNESTREVFADEIKTGRRRFGQVEPDDHEQMARYLPQLTDLFGADFLGVRLIMLGPPAHAYLFRAVDLAIPICTSRFPRGTLPPFGLVP